MQQPSPINKNRALLFDKLHKFSLLAVFGVSAVATGLLLYNMYLFKTEGVPMLVNKYRSKAEEEIALKQKEAEYIQERKRAEKELISK